VNSQSLSASSAQYWCFVPSEISVTSAVDQKVVIISTLMLL